MRGSKLMFTATLALLVNACAAMHEREWSDCSVDGGLLHGALGGLAGSPDVDRAHQSGTNDGRAAGAGLALGPVVSTVAGHLLCNEVKEAPTPPVAEAPPPSSETVEVRGPRPELGRATLNPEGNGLWLRLSAVLPLLDQVDDSVRSRKEGDE